jgi:hypothetical protein
MGAPGTTALVMTEQWRGATWLSRGHEKRAPEGARPDAGRLHRIALVALLSATFTRSRAASPEDYVPFVALGNVVSLMHFWYDGFVWSVRKGDV